MTNSEMCIDALKLCKKTRMFIPANEYLDTAINSLEENDKLKAEIEQLKSELEQYKKFKEYFTELYGQGLEVANWHLNGDTEPLDIFIDSAIEAEQVLRGGAE